MSGRRGRRPGAPDTRSAILAAARSRFAAHGFGATTIRGIATEAGVDAALVHHYFGSKDDLLIAALEAPVDLREVVSAAAAGGPEGAAERLLGTFLSVWDDPELQPTMIALARSLLEPSSARLLTEGFLPVVLLPVAREMGIEHPERRMPVVASQMMGLVLMRYVLAMEPLASMSAKDVVATYAPAIQHYLTGPLPGGHAGGAGA